MSCNRAPPAQSSKGGARVSQTAQGPGTATVINWRFSHWGRRKVTANGKGDYKREIKEGASIKLKRNSREICALVEL